MPFVTLLYRHSERRNESENPYPSCKRLCRDGIQPWLYRLALPPMARRGIYIGAATATLKSVHDKARQAHKNAVKEYKKAVRKSTKRAIATTGAICERPIAKHKQAKGDRPDPLCCGLNAATHPRLTRMIAMSRTNGLYLRRRPPDQMDVLALIGLALSLVTEPRS